MPAYIVCYDLNSKGQNYECITKKLSAYGTHWHMQGSAWVIVTDQTSTAIRDNLKACLDDNDELFVGRLQGEAAWKGYSDKISKWLKDNL